MSTGLDPRFVVTSDLENYYVDKDTGLPLSGGQIYFYAQDNPSVKKPVYQISTPSLTSNQYNYAALPNPSILSSVGTFQDALGNNIVPYYFPFEGTPDDQNSTAELYYIEVYNSDSVLQFTRIGWPNNGEENSISSLATATNYVPNGQFIAHNDHMVTPTLVTGAPGGNVDYSPIAQGGWFIATTDGGANIYNNSFSQVNTPIPSLGDSPRYIFNFVCTSNAGDGVRDLVIRWAGVNTFAVKASPSDPDAPYTFFIAAQATGSQITFEVERQYYFGSDSATPSIDTPISSLTITNTDQYFVVPITFPQQNGVIGPNNDDFVQVAIRGPASGSWNVSFTDGGLLFGTTQSIPFFPVKTEAMMMSEATAGWLPLPAPNNADLYLPIKLGASGFIYDDSEIGTVVAKFTATADDNELACDGTSYITSAYSTLGIPYSRLQSKWFNTTYGIPLFGTGEDFVNTYVSNTNQLIIATNKFNAPQTIPANGTTSTGFTFVTRYNIGTSGYAYTGYANGTGYVTAILNAVGPAFNNVSASAGTSTFTEFTDLKQPSAAGNEYAFSFLAKPGSALVTGSVGLYFLFSTQGAAYAMWFNTGTEVAPSPAGSPILIQCQVTATMSAGDIANVIANTITGYQTNFITVPAAPTASAYFIFNANSQVYVVWYTVDNVGTPPVMGGAIFINVMINSADTNAQVATKTQLAINSYSFAVPNLQGLFLRGADPTAIWDLSVAKRFGFNANSLTPTSLGSAGTVESDTMQNHLHSLTTGTVSGSSTGFISFGQNVNPAAVNTSGVGLSENRPVNMSVNYFVKY